MCPIPVDVIEKSCKQVEDLFDQFLKIDPLYEDFLPKKVYRESDEVQYESFTRGSLQRDSAKRLSSGNEFRLVPRGTETVDQRSLDVDIARKRRSLELERRNVSTPPPTAAPTAPTSGALTQHGLQRDSRQMIDDEKMEVQTVHSPQFQQTFEEGRPRTHSQGPTEQQMHDAALIIAGVGDQIERQYGGRMAEMRAALSHFINTADKTLSYETFAVHVNGLVGDDRDWTNFMFMMHLSRRVLIETSSVGKTVTNYFRRYLGAAFAEQIAQRTDVVQFVAERPSSQSSV